MSTDRPPKNKRPFLFKLLSLILLLMALYGWLRFGQSIYQWKFLLDFGVNPSPLYILVSGLLIGVVLTTALIAFWFQLKWSTRFVQVSVVLAALYWWLDYLLLTQNQAAFSNWPFRLAASLVVLGFIFSYLHLNHARNRKGQNEKPQ